MSLITAATEGSDDVLRRLAEATAGDPSTRVGPVMVVALVTDDSFVYPLTSSPTDEVIGRLDPLERGTIADALRRLADRWDPAAREAGA